jgi:hypothetical protein
MEQNRKLMDKCFTSSMGFLLCKNNDFAITSNEINSAIKFL